MKLEFGKVYLLSNYEQVKVKSFSDDGDYVTLTNIADNSNTRKRIKDVRITKEVKQVIRPVTKVL